MTESINNGQHHPWARIVVRPRFARWAAANPDERRLVELGHKQRRKIPSASEIQLQPKARK